QLWSETWRLSSISSTAFVLGATMTKIGSTTKESRGHRTTSALQDSASSRKVVMRLSLSQCLAMSKRLEKCTGEDQLKLFYRLSRRSMPKSPPSLNKAIAQPIQSSLQPIMAFLIFPLD